MLKVLYRTLFCENITTLWWHGWLILNSRNQCCRSCNFDRVGMCSWVCRAMYSFFVRERAIRWWKRATRFRCSFDMSNLSESLKPLFQKEWRAKEWKSEFPTQHFDQDLDPDPTVKQKDPDSLSMHCLQKIVFCRHYFCMSDHLRYAIKPNHIFLL